MKVTTVVTRMALVLGFALLIGLPATAKDDKVQVCHVPPGNQDNAHEITVSPKAVDKHLLKHEGDKLGPCVEEVVCPCWTAEDLVALLANVEASDELSVGYCELDVEPYYEEAWSTLNIDARDAEDNYLGSLYLDTRLDAEDPEYNECQVQSSDDYDFGIPDVEMENITVEEATQCTRMLGEICVGLRP
jgi:hypothetical protein